MKASEFILSEGGGYIPKNTEEARDPRWMMAITNDIKPGETQRQAAKMGFKTDKEGRPPLLKANGKLSENVVWMNDEMPCPACEGGENPPHSNHCPWCNNTGKTTKRTAKYYEVMSGKTNATQ